MYITWCNIWKTSTSVWPGIPDTEKQMKAWGRRPSASNEEFKKLRRQLQRKRHIKNELCVKLRLLRLFHVDHVVRNRRTALSLAWYEWFSFKGKEWKIYCCELRVVVRTSNMKISRCRLADYVKTLHQKACRTCSMIIFLHSTNQIIDLWRCLWRCRRQIFNSLLISIFAQLLIVCITYLRLQNFLPMSMWFEHHAVNKSHLEEGQSWCRADCTFGTFLEKLTTDSSKNISFIMLKCQRCDVFH